MNTNLTFIAIDFETANSDYSSICQIGMVFFENGEIVNEVSQLIDPLTHFEGMNISKHGINPSHIQGKPSFIDFFPELYNKLHLQVAIHHQPFDYSAFTQACNKHQFIQPETYWLDNAAVVKRTWEQFKYKGYGLKNVANHLGIEFNHHDACEDARVAGLVFIEACKLKGLSIEEWAYEIDKKRIYVRRTETSQRISGELLSKIDLNSCEENYFKGKKVVISGTYLTWPDRKELAKMLKSLGSDIDTSVGERTNILCAGLGVGPKKIEIMKTNIEAGRDSVIINEQEIKNLLGM